jgi:glycosyltransferase involved in cell wall biosynthesis
VVYTVHGFFGPSAAVDYRSAAWVANRAVDRLICVSHVEREKLLAAGLRPEKAAVVWNGVPAPRLPSPDEVAAFRARFGLTGERVVAGAVGRLEKQKGLEYLIEAARLLAERGLRPQLLLVGDGREREALSRQAAEAGVEVTFTGFLGEAERDAALAAIDVLVMPSIGEALPLALIEAMGAGKPVVATTVGGIPEIVQEGESGFLVPPAEAGAFADRLAPLVAEAGLRVRCGEAARQFFAAHLTNEAMAAKTEQIYLEVLKRRG